MKRIQLHLLLALLTLALSLILFGIGPRADPEAECASYCQTYWADDAVQYQQCVEGCGR